VLPLLVRLRRFASVPAGLALIISAAPARAADGDPSLSDLKQLSIDQLMQTEVTSVSLYPEKLQNAASAIQVITDRDIEDSGALTIPDALRLVTNLDIAQKNPHDWAISARGFNSNVGDKLLVLIDGRTVYTPIFSGVFWSSQDYLLADLDRVEVISGPGGTLYGANAVNGVINIATKSAADTQGGYLETGLGDDLQQFIGARYGGVLAPNVYYRAYVKYIGRGDADLATGQSTPDSWEQTQAGFRIDGGGNTPTKFTVQGDIYSGGLNETSVGLARLEGGNLLSRYIHTGADDSELSLQVYYDRTYLSEPFPASFNPAGLLRDDLSTYDAELQDNFRLGDSNHVVWGTGFRWTDERVLEEAPNVAFLPPHDEQQLYSVFAQDEYRLASQWFLTAGTKVEHNVYSRFEFEPNVRLRYDLTPQQTLWAAVSRAIRAPSRFDTDLAEPNPPPKVVLGNPNFASEILVAYELGYRAQLTKDFALSIANFYNDYSRLRSEMLTPVTFLPVIFGNGLYGDTYGSEITATYQLASNCTFYAGYDVLKEHLAVEPGQSNIAGIVNETEDPEHQIFLRSAIKLPAGLEFDPAMRWIGALSIKDTGTSTETVSSYAELNARLAWRCSRNLELSITGENLLHPHHAEYNPQSATREEIPRMAWAKAAYSF